MSYRIQVNNILISFKNGETQILDWGQFPPCVIQIYNDHKDEVLDLAYQDIQKILISTDRSRCMVSR